MIRALPHYSPNGSDIVRHYVTELKQASDLYMFIERWRTIFLADHPGKPPTLAALDKAILDYRFDLATVKRCMEINRTDLCPHHGQCVAGNMLLPHALVMTMVVSRHFGVPESVAFHQLFCRDEEHRGCF